MSTDSPAMDADTAQRPAPANRRREKARLSCNLCRQRKSRCDRRQPCSTCSTRALVCAYPENRAPTLMPKLPPTAPPPSLHDRLVLLEQLVVSLKQNSTSVPTPASRPSSTSHACPEDSSPSAPPVDALSECGNMRVSASELQYVEDNHWVTILDSIADLKDHVDQEEVRMANLLEENSDHGPKNGNPQHVMLLYGYNRQVSAEEIIEALPAKDAVNRHVSRYFNLVDSVAASLHRHSFLQEYEKFWANPSSFPVAWVGLLFSIICLSLIISDTGEFGVDHNAEQKSIQIDFYREKIVQCLYITKYTRPGPYVLETLMHYGYIELIYNTDANTDAWFLLSLEINMAMRMGYHRDPSHFPKITPLKAEIRRRMWSKVLISDILISSQMGMPRMISGLQFDTAEPRNLNDDDLNSEMTELPPSRPETEYTTSLNLIARRRLMIAMGAVLDHATSIESRSYDDAMRVDDILNKAADSIPPPLKWTSKEANITDPPQIFMARLFIRHMVFRGKIMLHQNYLFMDSLSTEVDTFTYSRTVCLDSALSTLMVQQLLDEETKPGGQLHSLRWRVTSSMNHLFLSATMILCLMLHRQQTLSRKDQILSALQKTRQIWLRKSADSDEAKKATEAINFALAKARRGVSNDSDPNNQSGSATAASSHGNSEIYVQKMLGDAFSSLPSDGFVEPSLLSISNPEDQNLPDITFMTDIDMNVALDEWMMMDAPEPPLQEE